MKWKEQPYHPGHSGYVSEFGRFIDGYLASHPKVQHDQLRGWYIWWDHKVDFDELARERQDEVPVHSYYYE